MKPSKNLVRKFNSTRNGFKKIIDSIDTMPGYTQEDTYIVINKVWEAYRELCKVGKEFGVELPVENLRD